MRQYHLVEQPEIPPPSPTPVEYGRYLASVRPDGTIICDDHIFIFDAPDPPDAGERILVWCNHDYFCCKEADYESEAALKH